MEITLRRCFGNRAAPARRWCYNDTMDVATLKKNAKSVIDSLSGPRLRAASEFLAFVQRRELDPATLELLSIRGLEECFSLGLEDVRKGRTRPWREVRDDV